MVNAGASRDRLAGILGTAFADGLLSEQTLSHRLGLLFGSRLVDADRVIGDLWIRDQRRRPWWRWRWRWPASLAVALTTIRQFIERPAREDDVPSLVLGLDWAGGDEDLLIGRHESCDVVLENDSVSRRHARLLARDGSWIVEDLASLNGTSVNGVRVGRCQLQPGDHLSLGHQHIEID